MAFDPNLPFEIESNAPSFDISKPFEVEEETPVGTSIGEEISQIPAALKQSFGQPLEAMGETANVAGFPAIGAALKGAIEEPEGYVSAGQRFIEPQEGEFQLGGFAPQYLPRAITEQTGQILGSIGTRIAGAVTGGGLGALLSPATGVAGAAIGSFAGPALFEAAQIVGPVALERAKNNGYTEPTDKDMAYAVAAAAGSGLLNAFGAKYLPGGEKAVGSFSKRLAASFIGEGVPEGLQSLVQQVGETVETNKGIQVNPKQAIGEALIGGGAGAASTIITAPFTPEQIAEAKIDKSANEEAEKLSIGNDNPKGKAVLANKQKLEQEVADTKQILQTIEATDPEAQKLKLELKEKETILAAAQSQVDSIVDSNNPVIEAERQQIELARAITQPEPKPAKLPTMPSIEEQEAGVTYGGETGVFDVFAGARRKPVVAEEPPVSMVGKEVIPGVTPESTEPTIKETLPVVPEAPAITPAPVEEVAAVEEPTVKISRGKDFSMDGEYNVSIGDKKYRIYKDPERGYWYDAGVREDAVTEGKSSQGSPWLGLLSTETRKDAIAELVNKYKKERPTPVAETPAAPTAEVAPAAGDIQPASEPKAQQAISATSEAISKKEPLPQTRGNGIQYHGARGPIENLIEAYYSEDNIYGGEGTFYTTDALDIAAGYQRKKQSGVIYRVDETNPVNFFNMEERKPKSEWLSMFEGQGDFFEFALDIASDQSNGTPSLREIMDEMRGESANEGLTKNDVQEFFGSITYNLQKQGYGGMTHIGGLKTNREPHTVKIYFDPVNQISLSLEDVTKPSQKAPTPAVSETITPKASPVINERIFSEDYTGARYTYGLRNRPLDIGTAPKGYIIGSNGPAVGRARNGTIQYPRQLTKDEIYDYELEVMEEIPATPIVTEPTAEVAPDRKIIAYRGDKAGIQEFEMKEGEGVESDFGKGPYFSSSKRIATSYAAGADESVAGLEVPKGKEVYTAEVDIKKPLWVWYGGVTEYARMPEFFASKEFQALAERVRATGDESAIFNLEKAIKENGFRNYKGATFALAQPFGGWEKAKVAFKEAGFDGIAAQLGTDGDPSTQYVPFAKEQVSIVRETPTPMPDLSRDLPPAMGQAMPDQKSGQPSRGGSLAEALAESIPFSTFENPANLVFKEKEQERGRIDEIKEAFGTSFDAIDWDEQPKPIVTIDGNGKKIVQDGHHRIKAWLELGFAKIPVIQLGVKLWNRLENDMGLSSAGMSVAEFLNDYYTSGQNSYQGSKARDIEVYFNPPAPSTGAANYSIGKKQDTEYLAAVESGDMEAVQRMVDEAIVLSLVQKGDFVGYGIRKDTGFLKTGDNVKNSFVWEDGMQTEGELEGSSSVGLDHFTVNSKNIQQAIKRAKSYRGNMVLIAGDDFKGGEDIGEYIIANAKVIYDFSEPAVTRDDQGNIIPLSQRFNPRSAANYSIGSDMPDLSRDLPPAKSFSPSFQTSIATESPATTNLRNRIKEAKGSDRKIVVMQAMGEGIFFPAAIEAAEFGNPFPSIDKTISQNLPDELKSRIDTSKIKLPAIKTKSPEEAASPLTSNDDARFILKGVFFDSKNNVVVATDGRAIVVIPKKITGEDKVVAAKNIKETKNNKSFKKGDIIGSEFPNWKQVIPKYNNIESFNIDIDDALKSATILDSLNNTLNNREEESLIIFGYASFDPKYILSSVTSLVQSGARSITAQIKSKEDPLLLTGDNGAIAVVMAKKKPTAILHPLKTKPKSKLGEKGSILIPSREDFIQAGQNIYEKGMEFGTWAKQMIQEFGDVVREFLGEVWQVVSGVPAKFNEVMGYLPKKGEGGALSFDIFGKLKRYTDRGTIVRLAIKQEKDTPKGILSETIKIIKQRVFDGDSTPSEATTRKAWGLIERLEVKNKESSETAEAINQLTRETMQEVSIAEDSTEVERQAFEAIKQTVGAVKLNNELYKYAIKLAGQGDDSMLKYLLNNELNIVGTSVRSAGDVGRTLGALAGLKNYIVQANEAEQAGFIQLAAQRFFSTTKPTEDQIAKIKRILFAVNETKVNEEEVILEELTEVGGKIGTELVENINTQIDKASKPEVKDPMVAAIVAMLKLGGTFVYKKTKNKIKAAVEKTIKGGLTGYRDKLVEGSASGLESGFWKTLASTENKPGPLGELDSAQNRELGNIVKSTLISLKLQGKPPNTKMSINEQVASILGEKPLSQDKVKLADEKIRSEINRKREKELSETEDSDVQDAINLKYDQIEFAWDESMSRNLDMPVSDTMLRRLIFNELKEGKTSVDKLATLMNEEPTIGISRQDRIVSSIINKIAGVTFEGQNPADYTLLKEYLSNQLESLVREKQTKKKAVTTKERTKANQAQTELDKLARIQSDTPNFPTSEKIANPVKDAVRNALKLVLNPMFDPKASIEIMRNWKGSFAAELEQLGVDETTALTLTDVVGRQIEMDSVSKNLDSIDKAINKGALSEVINAIKTTPLADQQKPNWRFEVMRDYLRSAGLTPIQSERIAKLMDISLQKRFAKAQEEAATSTAKTILGGINPESNRGFVALMQAIRAQVLNPGSNVAKEFGQSLGWKGFTPKQLKALNEFDSKVNDETITDAERAVALEGIKKIIDRVALPQKVRDSISAFYIGQALGRFTVATVQVVDPIIFSLWESAVASARNINSPSQVMQIWGNYLSSFINAAREATFSFKNDITRSGRLVDYLETADRKLKRLNIDANNLWKSGKYIQAIKKYLFGYPEITSRILKALDDAAFSFTQQNSLNLYMISAMNMAKIPKKDQLGALRMIAQARQMDISDMIAKGISKNDATIYANERMKAEISRVMSGLNLNSAEIIDSAINESLSRIGKTRFKEQLSGETELKDEGTLSYPFLKIYELTSQAISGVKGKRGEAMRIFQRMFFGFPLIVARVANVAYGYTPLTVYRHLATGRYPLTYGTALQRRKRLVEQLSGFAVLAPLLFLRSMSFDDDDEPIKIVFTGFGPVRSKDAEAYNQWNKKHNPGSLEIFIGGKRYALDSKSAGPLKPMIEILGAIDDWEIRKFQEGAKITKEEMKQAQENAGLLGTLGQIAGSFALTAARRGPATGLMDGLINFRRYPDDPIAAIAQEASFSLTPFIPVIGFGATKNISDFLSEPIDIRTKEGALLNNIPIIGPMFGKPAINAFGQPIGDVQISEKIKKSIGIPITLVSVSSGDDAKLAKITLKNANGPEPLQRNWFDGKFETPLSDQEWRTVVEDYAKSNRKIVLENYEELNGYDSEIYKIAISNVGTQSKYTALDNLDKSRKKP